mmetsp:Transcript_17828/g.49371  ORF Transcript_17828/g.49371 Transcript_17828/m.49371 type:complete len:587 (-) Transcript_17828:144-1904(-)
MYICLPASPSDTGIEWGFVGDNSLKDEWMDGSARSFSHKHNKEDKVCAELDGPNQHQSETKRSKCTQKLHQGMERHRSPRLTLDRCKQMQDEVRQRDKNLPIDSPSKIVDHPYVEELYKRKFTLSEIKQMEDIVVSSLMERSNWDERVSSRPFFERCPLLQRVVAVRLTDRNNIFGDTMERIPGYDGSEFQQRSEEWRLPPEVAVLDRVREMSLYRCTGLVPREVGLYLKKLTALYLNACSRLDLSVATCSLTLVPIPNALGNLKILKVVDCEDVTPRQFALLQSLETLALTRWRLHNHRTLDLGQRWVRELALPAAKEGLSESFAFQPTLQSLSFRDAHLTTEDLRTIVWKVLPSFPALESLSIARNAGIDSFRAAMEPPDPGPTFAQTMGPNGPLVSCNLKSLKLLHTRIIWTKPEVDGLVWFLETIGASVNTLDVFSLYTTPRYNGGPNNPRIVNLKNRAHDIEYLLARNAMNPDTLLRCGGKGRDGSTGARVQPRELPPRGLWPLALTKAYSRWYSTFDDYNGTFTTARAASSRKTSMPFAMAYDFLRHGSIFSMGQTESWCKRKRQFLSRRAKKRVQYYSK